jgi:acetolactate synthase-1/2/3 large subunit
MFGNPTPAHFVANAYGLATLTIITNNRMWGAVRRATLSIYPDGEAARANQAPLTYLEPTPDYEKVVTASGGHGMRVEDPAELLDTLTEATRIVDDEQRSVVVNVQVEYRDDAAIEDAKR